MGLCPEYKADDQADDLSIRQLLFCWMNSSKIMNASVLCTGIMNFLCSVHLTISSHPICVHICSLLRWITDNGHALRCLPLAHWIFFSNNHFGAHELAEASYAQRCTGGRSKGLTFFVYTLKRLVGLIMHQHLLQILQNASILSPYCTETKQ